jgi:S-(hydroxymethyl)glutathione dehydrogenase/alcohol dehydrogenase
MKAAVLHRPGAGFVIEDVDLAPPRDGEVEVRIAASGVCHSDHHLLTGATQHPMPVVCGHEGAGVVERTGSGVTRLKPGDHVILSWAPRCGACFYCLHGLPAQCEAYLEPIWNGTMRDGTTRLSLRGAPVYHYAALASFAERAVVDESCCVPVAADVPLEVAALVGCAVATGVGAAIFRAPIEEGSSVAVFGCGGVGMSIVCGAAQRSPGELIAVDRSDVKLALARRLGATRTINAAREDPVAAIRAATGGRGADCTLEAIGDVAVMQQAIAAARRGGTIVLVGLGPHAENLTLGAGEFTRSDKILTSAYYGGCDAQRDMPRIIALYQEGRLPLDALVTRRRPLEEINAAFADMLAGDTLRTVITF